MKKLLEIFIKYNIIIIHLPVLRRVSNKFLRHSRLCAEVFLNCILDCILDCTLDCILELSALFSVYWSWYIESNFFSLPKIVIFSYNFLQFFKSSLTKILLLYLRSLKMSGDPSSSESILITDLRFRFFFLPELRSLWCGSGLFPSSSFKSVRPFWYASKISFPAFLFPCFLIFKQIFYKLNKNYEML